jgi:hypothetical protein
MEKFLCFCQGAALLATAALLSTIAWVLLR